MSIALKILLFPFKIIATIIFYILKTVTFISSFVVLGCSLPFIWLSGLIGELIGIIATLGLAAMLLCWYFGDLDGKTVLITTFSLGIISALFLASEQIAAAIENALLAISEFFSELIGYMWTT